MKALLIGGFGGFGYSVAKKFLQEGCDVYVQDNNSRYSDNDDSDDLIDRERDSLPVKEVQHWFSENYDYIVMLAEENNLFCTSEHYINTNVLLSNTVANSFGGYKISRLVIVGWLERFQNNSVVEMSLNDRMKYPLLHNRGNNIISVIRLPRIVSPFIHQDVFGNIVKRVYNSIKANKPPCFYEGEVGIPRLRWISDIDAAEAVYQQAIRRTRKEEYLVGIKASAIAVARYTAYRCGLVSGELRTEKKTYDLRIKNMESYLKRSIPPELQFLIDGCINAWERCRE